MEIMLRRADVVTVSSGMRRKDVAVVLVARSEGIYPDWSRILWSNITSEMKFRNGHKKRRKRSTKRTEFEWNTGARLHSRSNELDGYQNLGLTDQ